MKKIVLLFIAAQNLATTSCSKSNDAAPVVPEPRKGIVQGEVKYADGSPNVNTKVLIENTIYYASYVYAITNAKVEYSVPVPIGSCKAWVQIEKEFLGKKYEFDLHPDNALACLPMYSLQGISNG